MAGSVVQCVAQDDAQDKQDKQYQYEAPLECFACGSEYVDCDWEYQAYECQIVDVKDDYGVQVDELVDAVLALDSCAAALEMSVCEPQDQLVVELPDGVGDDYVEQKYDDLARLEATDDEC